MAVGVQIAYLIIAFLIIFNVNFALITLRLIRELTIFNFLVIMLIIYKLF